MCSVVERVSSNGPAVTSYSDRRLVDYTKDKIVALVGNAITGEGYIALWSLRTKEHYPVVLEAFDGTEHFKGFSSYEGADLIATDNADCTQVMFSRAVRGRADVPIGSVDRRISYERDGGAGPCYFLKSVEGIVRLKLLWTRDRDEPQSGQKVAAAVSAVTAVEKDPKITQYGEGVLHDYTTGGIAALAKYEGDEFPGFQRGEDYYYLTLKDPEIDFEIPEIPVMTPEFFSHGLCRRMFLVCGKNSGIVVKEDPDNRGRRILIEEHCPLISGRPSIVFKRGVVDMTTAEELQWRPEAPPELVYVSQMT